VSDKILHVGDADFDAQVLRSSEPVLVDFWAEWCGPCKAIAPMLDEMATAYAGRAKIAKVNVDHNPQTARQFQIRGLPTLILFKDGKPVGTQMGVPPDMKQRLAKLVDSGL
jgi:thioredoxin 1